MSADRFAVIDCGTNTFHLLVVEKDPSEALGFKEVYRDRKYVFLAEGGINTIADEAIDRAKTTIDGFHDFLVTQKNIQIDIVGTEALRIASNGYLIKNYILEKLGTEPIIISGDREADLIFKGNNLVVKDHMNPYLIMDIGGGSTEYILVIDGVVDFKKSYPLGVTKLYNEFHDGEPISDKAIQGITNHMTGLLQDLMQSLHGIKLNYLLGASGSFEVLSTIVHGKIPASDILHLSIKDFDRIYHSLIDSTLDSRLQLKSIPESRAKLIVVSLVMISHIISIFKPNQIGISPFAIKEGLIAEWLDHKI